MKIRTRLKFNTWITVGVIMLMTLSLAWSFWEIGRADRNKNLVSEMRKAAFERILFRDEYLLYREDRAGIQWRAKSETLEGLMESGSGRFTSKKDKALLQDVRKDFNATLSGFSTILEKYEREKRSVGRKLAFDEADSRLIGQVFLKAYALQDSINRLYESTEMEAVTTRNREFILIIFFVLGGGVAIILNSIVAGRIVAKGVMKLHEEVGIIGSGNLDYRIDAKGDDELAALARASNDMAAKLKESHTSMASLQQEITERKRVEGVLKDSEERYRTAIEQSNDGVAIMKGDFHLYVNQKFLEMFGYNHLEEIIGKPLSVMVHPDDRDRVMEINLKRQKGEDVPSKYEFKGIRKNGDIIYIEVSATKTTYRGEAVSLAYLRDITERKRAEDVLRESEERSRSLIETSPDIIMLIDFSGKIIVVNGIALTTYGYESKDEVIGKSVLDFVIPEDRPRVLQEISKILEVKTLRNLEYTSLKKDGSTFSIEVSASLILDAQQKPASIVIMIRDITERKRATAELVSLNKQLEAAKEAAEAGSRAKGEFLASMSHEIRTPLNAVIGMLGLLSTSELSGPHREYVEIAHSSVDGLLVIINDILDFSKIEAGKLFFEPVSFDLLRVVEETIDMMVMKTREKGLDLTVQYGPDVPRHFIGDSGRIRQVLINLVNNAVKFTHKGHVLIDVRTEEPMNEEVLLRITVEDTGIGISSDTLGALFKPFVQADASTTRRYGGTGLGLAISKRLVEMMGGTIGASSRSGEGSAFWFTLCLPLDKEFTGVAVPMAEKVALHPPVESGAPQTAPPQTARWGRPLRVLVVEDNVVNQRVTMLMLTELGCHVDLAANGRGAIEMVEILPLDMVFMDCEMPEMDGFEATGEIRRLQGDKHLPIIAMTAYALQGDRERCLAAGMDDYFSKPVALEDFQAALERWGPKDSRSFEGRLKPPASLEKAPPTVENETSSVIDPNVMARLQGLADATDPSLLTRIFHLFLSDTPERITTLREAAATGDTAGLSKAAHSLRGACASIGVMGMVEICKTLKSLGQGKYVDGAMALVEKLETEFNQAKVQIEREIAPSPPPSPLGGEEKGEGSSVKDRDIKENDQNEDSHFGR